MARIIELNSNLNFQSGDSIETLSLLWAELQTANNNVHKEYVWTNVLIFCHH